MRRIATIAAVALGAWLLLAAPALAASPPAGPPYPNAVTGQRVYDYAGIFRPDTITEAQSIIDGIESRTGAQVAVYTQLNPGSDTLDKANADALALMNQWGVGRKGFDDGLVIMFDMRSSLHGEVSLYAGSGYKAAFLSDSERQAIFDNDMKPLLSDGDLDGGLLAGLHDIDANATPAHAAALEQGRQINALVAAGGAVLGLLLILVASLFWFRHGRDASYVDDNSILMPAPPADLTPGMATLLMAEKTSDRTVSAGLVDLAARGCISFTSGKDTFGDDETGIKYLGAGGSVLPDPEAKLRDAIDAKSEKHEGYLAPPSLYRLVPAFNDYRDQLETAAVKRAWLTSSPSRVRRQWNSRGGLELVAGIMAGVLLFFTGASGLTVVAIALVAAGIFTVILAPHMPSRTRQGAMLWAMLTAYRRTLVLSMGRANSMGDVVKDKALPWVTTPDQVMAWGVAFGLNDQIEAILSRAMGTPDQEAADEQDRAWYPRWWVAEPSKVHTGHGSSPISSGGSGIFSASAIPNPGSIMAALGSIAHPSFPVSSSGGSSGSSFSSGGSFGGGGGGGGGGAGGGF